MMNSIMIIPFFICMAVGVGIIFYMFSIVYFVEVLKKHKQQVLAKNKIENKYSFLDFNNDIISRVDVLIGRNMYYKITKEDEAYALSEPLINSVKIKKDRRTILYLIIVFSVMVISLSFYFPNPKRG